MVPGKGVKSIAAGADDVDGRGKGFVLALAHRRPEPEAAYRAWHRARTDNGFGLGAALLAEGRARLTEDRAAAAAGLRVHARALACDLADRIVGEPGGERVQPRP